MHKYEQPNVEVLSFRPDEALMDQNIGTSGVTGGQTGGGIPGTYSLHDSHDNR